MDENELRDQFDPAPGPDTEPEDACAPYREAKEQRQQNAAIIEEHDNLLADILFEVTMNELEV